MPLLPPILEKGTCEDCTDPVWDADCPRSPCVEHVRMASACDCTCKTMGFATCAEKTSIEFCSCTDGTAAPGSIIIGMWFGFSDATVGQKLADIARVTCGNDPTTKWRLWGTTWDFDTHATTQDMSCRVDTAGLVQMTWGTGGIEEETDLASNALVTCTGGVVHFTADDLGIATIPVTDPVEGSVSCTQEGGVEMLLVEVEDNCGNTLVLCPVAGVIGNRFSCELYSICCKWSIDFEPQACAEEGGEATIIVIATMDNPACECAVTETVTINGVAHVLTGTAETYFAPVNPCSPGQVVEVIRSRVYSCDYCAPLNATDPPIYVTLPG